MAEAGKHASRWLTWTAALPNDVQRTWELMQDPALPPQGRRCLAGALSYFLTQLDLIPDHEKAGAVDDAFVLRVAYGLIAEHSSHLGAAPAAQVARLTNEEDELHRFLGDALFAKLRRYVLELATKPVRGRTPEQILSDERARGEMKRELDQSMKRLGPQAALTSAEAEQIEVSVVSYLKMKLAG
jgi:uncharacterized membrane protein YkvA (DUF1232 family)